MAAMIAKNATACALPWPSSAASSSAETMLPA